MVEEADTPSSPERVERAELDPWARWLCAVLGILAVAGSAFLIFMRDGEVVGPIALLCFGALFLLLSVVGEVPASAKIGVAELQFRKYVLKVSKKATIETPLLDKGELAEELSELAAVAPKDIAPILAGYAYEQMVLGLLAELVNDTHIELALPTGDIPYFDALLTGPLGINAAVEVKNYKAMLQRGPHEVTRLIQKFTHSRQPSTRLLLITDKELPSRFDEVLRENEPLLTCVVVKDRQDDQALYQAVVKTLGLEGRAGY